MGDETRLLGYGTRADGRPNEYWISLDGTQWTQLALSGDTLAALAGTSRPFLLRDGNLFNDGKASDYAAPIK